MPPYSHPDVQEMRRAAKAFAAAMQALHDDIRRIAETAGHFIALLDNEAGVPLEGGVTMAAVETQLIMMDNAYTQLRQAVMMAAGVSDS